MNLISQLLIGLLIGYTARFFLPGHDRWGWIVTTLVGVGGAWAGPQIASKLGMGSPSATLQEMKIGLRD